MTHDPLCPAFDHAENHYDDYWCSDECDAECRCDLIARVRADTLDRARAAVQSVASGGGSVWSTGFRAVAAIDALRGES